MNKYQLLTSVKKSIFRAYDIRGVVGEGLVADSVYTIGRAIGSEVKNQGQHQVVIGRDARLSSPELSKALVNGLRDSGCDVVNIGEVPTPILYFATYHLPINSGVMLTASHNPSEYNGLKIIINGKTLAQDHIQELYNRIIQTKFSKGEGSYKEVSITQDYLNAITSRIRLSKPLKVVLDCGNGVAGNIAPDVFRGLGCEVIELFCDVDGTFPNHHPDPTIPENLTDIIAKVKETNADIGLALDGDADRLGVVTNKGNIIWADRQLMLYAIDVLSRNPGADILYDVKCTRHLSKVIRKHGGNPIMWQTGHALLKIKMKEVNSLLGGEMSGHVFFEERWYGFDDGIYTGARLLEILSKDDKSIDEIFAELPDSINTPELKLPVVEKEKFLLMDKIIKEVSFPEAELITIDGLRVEFNDGWGLIRPSNTSPYIILRFEADNEQSLQRIKELFREQLLKIDKDLQLPF